MVSFRVSFVLPVRAAISEHHGHAFQERIIVLDRLTGSPNKTAELSSTKWTIVKKGRLKIAAATEADGAFDLAMPIAPDRKVTSFKKKT